MPHLPFGPARVFAALFATLAPLVAAAGAQDAPRVSPAAGFISVFERIVHTADEAGLDALLDRVLTPERADILRVDVASGGPEAVLRDRDVAELPGTGPSPTYRIIVEMFLRSGDVARIVTYRLDVRRVADDDDTWRVRDVERLSSVEGLYRLRLDETTQFGVRDLRVRAEDFELALPRGDAFAARTPEGITALVLLGNGTMTFTPRPAAERMQVRIFSGRDTLLSAFTAVYLRMNPSDFEEVVGAAALTPARAVDAQALRRASAMFTQQLGHSFSLDLADLSRDAWSLLPSRGDLIADVRTRKHGLLTYAHAANEAEDISLFDRERRRNIAVYPSLRRLEVRGRGFDEDQLADYDVTDYDVQASYQPDREWLEGTARLRLRVRAYSVSTLTLRLAEALVVRSAQATQADRQVRLLTLRVRGQNTVIVGLPSAVPRDAYLTLTIRYAGRLESMSPDREVVEAGQNSFAGSDMPVLTPEPRWVFSNRSYWHPQNTITDFARGTMRLTVPAAFEVVASGDPVGVTPAPDGRRTWEFAARQPVRYLSWAISRFTEAGRGEVVLSETPETASLAASGSGSSQDEAAPGRGVFYSGIDIAVVANPRQVARGRSLLPLATGMLAFYGSLVGDLPYPSFTLALVDHQVPGGHSPAYFALLHQPLPTTPYTWRNDPVYFDDYPQFFVAHELAHQFWGQAVGWKSYHEQWISEGFAQYFALLYAERQAGPDVMRSVLARMRSSALTWGGQGPISLGYRLGHVKDDSRVFRAVVYNKSALVLHMLRGLLGDEAFFDGLRRFYRASRFTKAGTDDVRAAFEAASGRTLDRFFDRWIHEFGVPVIRYSGSAEGATLHLSFEQLGGTDYELPVTVLLRYADGSEQRHVVPVGAGTSRHAVPLRGALREWRVNEDRAALAEFRRS